MQVSDLSPFEPGGEHVPVVLIAPVPEVHSRTLDLDAQSAASRMRGRAVLASVVVLGLVLISGQWLVRPTDESWLGTRQVAGLDETPPQIASVHSFLHVGSVDITALVSLGGRTVLVRSVTNNGATTLWEREVEVGEVIGAVTLIDNSADRRVVLQVSAPRSLAGGVQDADVAIVLGLDDGEELTRRSWDPDHRLIPSGDGRLYRLVMASSEIQAMQDLNSVRWRTTIDPYMWLANPIELRPHGLWLLLVPDASGRRGAFRGSDVFLTAFDPGTGAQPEWLGVAAPGQRFQRLALEDMFVEHSVGAGERVVRARDWRDGHPRWQRFESGVIPLAVDDELYLTTATADGTQLMKINAEDGKELWATGFSGTMTLLLEAEDSVVAALPDQGILTVLDEDTGEVLRTLPYDGAPYLGDAAYFSAGLDPSGQLTVTSRSLLDGTTLWTETYPGFRALAQVGRRLLLVDPDTQRLAPMYPS